MIDNDETASDSSSDLLTADDPDTSSSINSRADDGDARGIDVEMALLALSASRDVGGPMQDLDLNSLTDAEKRLLLAMMQRRLGVPLNRDNSSDEESAAAAFEAGESIAP